MAYQFSFQDNGVYGAKEVNAITKRLVTSGVQDVFTDGVAYNVSKFNAFGAQLYTDGVVGDSAESLKVSKLSDSQLLIAPGVAFFCDGAVMEVLVGGHTLDFVLGEHTFVYLKNMLESANVCMPVCGMEEPEGDVVLLAEVLPDGTVLDCRKFAQGKLPGYEAPVSAGLCIEDYVLLRDGESETKVYDLGSSRASYIVAACFDQARTVCGLWRKDGVVIEDGTVRNDGKLTVFLEPVAHADATFSIADGKLSVTVKYFNPEAKSDNRRYVDFCLFVF